jgi:hypothetical protein
VCFKSFEAVYPEPARGVHAASHHDFVRASIGSLKHLGRKISYLLSRLIAPNHDKPVTRLVTVTTDQRHIFTCRLDDAVDQPAFVERRNSPFPLLSQVDFDLPAIAQMRPDMPVGGHLELVLAYLPVAGAPENTLKFPGKFRANTLAARLRRLILVVTPHELDIIRQGLFRRGGRER